MTQWKQKKGLCCFIMICMLFLGMCVESIHTGSFFSYESSAHSSSTLLSGERITLTAQEYKVETLSKNECITNSGSAIRHSLGRYSRGTTLNLLFVDLLPLIFLFIQTSSDHEHANGSSCSTMIINYIHHKDGKKA